MRFLLVAGLVLALPMSALAQGTPTSNRLDGSGPPAAASAARLAPASVGETDVDFISSYYQQNGDHGAVEGGIGTQHLTDVSPTIILNVPLDSVARLTANVGFDYYASASTDRIDQVLSSPSSRDVRYHLDLGYSRTLKDKRTILGLGGGASKEYDYQSFNLAGSWTHGSRDGNRELSIGGQVYSDQVTLILPVELRTGTTGTGNQKHGSGFDNRQSYNLNIVYSQVISKRLQLAVSTELVTQRGLLSTPFHRVYFYNSAPELGTPGQLGTAKTELLPRLRTKYPVGLRLNYYATDLVQIRGFYRFYNDNFGIRAHTFELEAPVKVTPFFTLYPFYRYHTQTAATYFAPYLAHSTADEFYSSDYDLAAFTAQKLGLGFRYAPLYGLSRFKTPFGDRVAKFKSIDLRYGHYWQTTGLTANIVSVDFSFVMP
ncbi:DUF3570 domain-containing protein [Hymenobacter nivis]|uniref:DUF3570 domain-containing protein n=1 Tax=Hymenobacter nivis TaxID=1850093 RepID=A0A2Z3GE76_9BACT|nr:DUF3570 domain-containing protein [Hymenobacter nivis]AWM31783.1 hypothetical protein DDQ68_02680 [Hymenobacter nivis]